MEKLKNWIIVVLVGVSLVIAAVSITRISQLNRQLDIEHQNYVAATDTIHTLELKNGEILEYNASLILDKRQIEQQLDDEKLDRREVERQLRSHISSLSKTIAEFKMDTIVLTDTVVIEQDSSISTKFRYTDEWTVLEGKTKILNNLAETMITSLSVDVPIMIGQTEDYQVFVHSMNPYVHISMLQNSISSQTIEDKAFRRLSLGMYVGVGFTYGTLTRAIDFGPQFGVGINYRLW